MGCRGESWGEPGRVAQSVGGILLVSERSWIRYPVWPHTFVSPSADSRGAVFSKYVHEVLVNRLGGLSLPRKSVVRLTDRPDMTSDVNCGRKTTTQQQQNRGVISSTGAGLQSNRINTHQLPSNVDTRTG